MLEGCGDVFATYASHFLADVTTENLVEGCGFFAHRIQLLTARDGVQVGPL